MITSPVNALFALGSRQVYKISFTGQHESFVITEGSIIVNAEEIPDCGIMQGTLNIDRYSASGQKVEIGSAIAAELSFELANFTGIFDDVVFADGELLVEIGTKDWSDPDAAVTYIKCGRFDIDAQPRRKSIVSIDALDRMARFDKPIGSITLPITVANLVSKACTDCSVTLANAISSLPNASYSVTELPEEFTYRQIIQQCAFLMGKCAYMDEDGKLAFGWYHAETYTITPDIRMQDSSDLFEGDITFTGVRYRDSEGTEHLAGSDGYTFDYEGCDILTHDIDTTIGNIWTAVGALTYKPCKCSLISAPFLWPLDKISYQNGDATETVIITNINYTGNGSTEIQGVGETTVQAGWSSFNGMTIAQKLAIAEINNNITNINNKVTAVFGTSNSAAGDQVKIVNCAGFSLFEGAIIRVGFTYKNTATGISLNVNNTGSVPIYVRGAAISSSNKLLWGNNTAIEFVYDGSHWVPRGYSSILYGSCSDQATDGSKAVNITGAVVCQGVEALIKMTNTNTANSPTLNINSTEDTVIHDAAGNTLSTTNNNTELIWTANATAAFVFDGQYWVLGSNHINAGSITVGKLTAITIEGPNVQTFWKLDTGEFQSYGTKSVTSHIYNTVTTFDVASKTNIKSGELTVNGRKTTPTEDPEDTTFADLGILSNVNYYDYNNVFVEDLSGIDTIADRSYPRGELVLRGHKTAMPCGSGTNDVPDPEVDPPTLVEYAGKGYPAAKYSTDRIDLGTLDDYSRDDQQSIDNLAAARNTLTLSGGWNDYKDAIIFTKRFNTMWAGQDLLKTYYNPPVTARPAWEIAPYELYEFDLIHAFGLVSRDRRGIYVHIPVPRPFSKDIVSFEMGFEFSARAVGSNSFFAQNELCETHPYGTTDYPDSIHFNPQAGISFMIHRGSGTFTPSAYSAVFMNIINFSFMGYDYDIDAVEEEPGDPT